MLERFISIEYVAFHWALLECGLQLFTPRHHERIQTTPSHHAYYPDSYWLADVSALNVNVRTMRANANVIYTMLRNNLYAINVFSLVQGHPVFTV